MIDKLLCGSSRQAAMGKFPGIGFHKKLLCRHRDSVTLCQSRNNVLEFLLVWRPEIDAHAKAVNQGKLLLYGIGGMQIFIICYLKLVSGFLAHKMTPVAGCIDQNVVRLFLQATLDHSLQIFIFDFKLLKGKIIHVKNKFVVAVLDLGDHIIQILELMLIHLDNTKSLVIVAVQNSLNTG